MNVELKARFIGHVQGVGFRYNASHVAKRLGLVGTVKNLADGSVELIAQGSQEKLEALLVELDTKIFPGHIDQIEKSFGEIVSPLSVFSIL